jgi:exodeoxyribonuclease V gamma subunit
VIVVQSQGIRRWLTLQLADTFGAAGSVDLPFPASFVHEIGRRVAPGPGAREGDDPYAREALAWRVDALLRALPSGEAALQPLRTYLQGANDRARFGLARQIAARLDDYQMFRADVLREWEAGRNTIDSPHSGWQAYLWRTICAEIGPETPHLTARLERSIAALERGAVAGLPLRVAVFGVSALPPLFIDLLVALARHMPVGVYAATAGGGTHPLAAAFGAQSREFLAALSATGAESLALDPPAAAATGILANIRRELATDAAGDSPLVLAAADASLLVHDAHGPLRQLEVLHDQLLAVLAADPALRPHDLLLLVPDATEWAPLVDAVFGAAGDDIVRIPYRIADRPMRRAQPAAEALSRLLALEGGRLARSEVFGLLAHPLARQAAGLTEAEVDLLETLTARANVRWGYDAQSRTTLGLPAYEAASWRAGLDRLLLGVATGPSDDVLLDLLPESGDTAGDPETIACFATWVDTLARTLAEWRTPRPPAAWCDTLLSAVGTFLSAVGNGEGQALLAVVQTIQRLGALGEIAGYGASVPFGVVQDWIESELDGDGFGSGFLEGGMTVAALKPMRSLPFRVIAVAGLDEGVFPRRERRSAFDLLEHERRPGDRDLRSDDRQLFLDLLLAAGDRLILAYTGHDVRDNSPRAPSVVIDELFAHLDGRTEGKARSQLLVEHPLQPFSPKYFRDGRDPRLFSFSTAQARAASSSANREETERPWITAPLPLSEERAHETREIALRDLSDCWVNPSKFFCRRVLRFSLGDDREIASDEELVELDYVDQGGVKSRMLSVALTGTRDGERECRRLVAEGKLPPGQLGLAWHRMLDGEITEVLEHLDTTKPFSAAPIDLEGAGWRLRGRIEGIQGETRYVVRPGSVRAEHRIRAWVEHVAMCAAREQGATGLPSTTTIVGKKGVDETYPSLRGARKALDGLIAAFRDAHRAPLVFFPQAGWAWFAAMRPKPKKKGGRASTPKDPRAEARAAYAQAKSDYNSMGGDAEDAYIALCFRGRDPMGAELAGFEQRTSSLFSGWPMAGGGDS